MRGHSSRRVAFKILGNMNLRGYLEGTRKKSGASEWQAYWAGGKSGTVTCVHPCKIISYDFEKQMQMRKAEDNMEKRTEKPWLEDPEYVAFKKEVIRWTIENRMYLGVESDVIPTERMLEDGSLENIDMLRDTHKHLCARYGYMRASSCPIFRIRKLTNREQFRLMDVDDSDIDRIQAWRWEDDDYETDCLGNEIVNVETGRRQKHRKGKGISIIEQYRLAGNSIVIACLEGIFGNLFCNDGEPFTDAEGQGYLF